MISDNIYQSMILVYDDGVVVTTRPPPMQRKFLGVSPK